MYRLLIVDDETYIATSLAAALAEYLDAESFDVDVAFSADDALGKMDRRRMDIIVSDIQMPGAGGIELRDAVRRRWPECQFIFLTGHGEFGYARDALRGGCVDFILKTEGDERVLEAVREAVRRLEAGREEQETRAHARRDLADSRRMLATEYLSAYARGVLREPSEARQHLSDLGAAPLLGSPFSLAFMRSEAPTPGEQKGAIEVALSLAAESFPPPLAGVPLGVRTAALLLGAAAGARLDAAAIRGRLEAVQDTISREGKRSISFVVDPAPADFASLPGRLLRLAEILESRPCAGGTTLIAGSEAAGHGGRVQSTDVIASVDAYIDAHLGEDVSLTRLAEVVSLNPAYLSRYYLQHSGRHLSERISEARLERATVLLRKGSAKVADIASAVGFWTPSHFIRFFKQRTGSTPQAFRDGSKS